jgi:hypothetical protein
MIIAGSIAITIADSTTAMITVDSIATITSAATADMIAGKFDWL